ncbi:hypothetical protein [Leptospira licerasiae]|uniref:Uncharacterized protein n=1 Tax=Leptospira licerasiae str. MMD4847 TaxID=1049971 RepID=A0ABN0H9S2_9LEPT|nr:hypothetical protein [Leptospira licerasiae]EIE00234.1 hypothetical protein LEP1GSC185_2422 [Leptospira licerasiae serovar Varillal str. VAR 010]EJZ42063.1 hypothetical protein LEP1GSC178_0196 [Leptospira licerasiae str. MMD4847]TGM94902.1 hypothetical protein EHR05_02260 [Leptospira licerasiae]
MSRTKKKQEDSSGSGLLENHQLSKEWERLELYLRGMGIDDSLEIHNTLSKVFEKSESSKKNIFEIFKEETSLRFNRDWESSLPPLEPGSMVPRPIDFGPLADLASPSAEKPEPVALVLTALFWAAVYISLAFWYFS